MSKCEYIPNNWRLSFAYDEVWVYGAHYNSLTWYEVGFNVYFPIYFMSLAALVFNIWNHFMNDIHRGKKKPWKTTKTPKIPNLKLSQSK